MSNMHKSTRLGDLLVERGAITRQQLRFAIETQQKRQLEEIHLGKTEHKMELGEILIELGFINRLQLDSGLTWQQKLRKTTMAMAFVAPLLTAACGGGASSNTGGSTTNTLAVASSSAQTITADPKPEANSFSSLSSSILTSSSIGVSSSAPALAPSTVSSAASSSQSSTAEGIDGPVVIYWSIPTFRENGDYLDVTEIGGYELRYKLKSESNYNTIHIDSGFTDTYYFDYLQGDYEFEIATFDNNNTFSDFVAINGN